MESKFNNIDQYVKENKELVNKQYRHTYHFSSPVGWINDPNGFVHAFNQNHLFFQFYPYNTRWGHISWGHAVTNDFVKWELLPVAIWPEHDYEKEIGIMSGTCLFEDNILYAYYAAGSRGEGWEKQQPSLAISKDGIHFEKYAGNPVIVTEDIPSQYNSVDCRDPKVFQKDGFYWMLVTAKEGTDGQLLMYKSKDKYRWDFVSGIIQDKFNMNGAFECPDFFQLGEKDVILCSPQWLVDEKKEKFQNVHSSVYMLGHLDFNTGKFQLESFDDIDSGSDFYAPQALKTPDGRIIMTAWMDMWDRTYPTTEDGWVGAMILPRELSVQNGKFIQQPVREIKNYRKNKFNLADAIVSGITSFAGVVGNKVELLIDVDVTNTEGFGLHLFTSEEEFTDLYFDKSTGFATIDRSNSGNPIESSNEKESNIRKVKLDVENNLKLQVFLDVSSIEIFFQCGEHTLTMNAYPKNHGNGIAFYTKDGSATMQLTKYDIIVETNK